jgi:hypothetical protein
LITQIKKLKTEKKTQEENLEQLINKDSLFDKETMINPIEVGVSSDIKVQTMDIETLANPTIYQ